MPDARDQGFVASRAELVVMKLECEVVIEEPLIWPR